MKKKLLNVLLVAAASAASALAMTLAPSARGDQELATAFQAAYASGIGRLAAINSLPSRTRVHAGAATHQR